jgi:hypothetical protein
MQVPLTLPLDSDGFLRRECPTCERQFKWHHGPANDEAEAHSDPPMYYCPLCGEAAGPDSWWTNEQLEYARGIAMPAALQSVQDEVANAFRGTKYVTYKPGATDLPDIPASLTEPDDMVIVTSACHDYEPIKVPEDAAGPFHCLICGTGFAV